MTGLLWHSVEPITEVGDFSREGVLGLLGLAPAALAVGSGRGRLGGEAGDGGVLSATGTCRARPAGPRAGPRAGARVGRTCWKADLTTSITSSLSELPESLWLLLLSPLRCDDGEVRRRRRGGGEEEVGDDVRSGVTTRPSGDGCAGSDAAEKAECGDLCSGEDAASKSAGAACGGACGGMPG